jgi:hypothetical protein
MMMSLSMTAVRPLRGKAIGMLGAIALLLGGSLLVALEVPSKAFLDKNSFYLSSAGFRVKVADDAAGQKALRALPPHRFVIHRNGTQVRYLYAEPNHCVCIFIGTEDAYRSYRDMLAQPIDQPDNVAPDYKTQADALLYGDPYDFNSVDEPNSVAPYVSDSY